MYKFEQVRSQIKAMGGDEFQVLAQRYATEEFNLSSPHYVGTSSGTVKAAKGTPDAFYYDDENKIIFLECGHYLKDKSRAFNKIKDDIEKCRVEESTLEQGSVDKIIYFYSYDRFSPSDLAELKSFEPRLLLIGPDELAEGLCKRHFYLANEYLGLDISTGSFVDLSTFKEMKDKDEFESSLKYKLKNRESDFEELIAMMERSQIVMITGKSGAGKTKLACEVLQHVLNDNADISVYCIKACRDALSADLNTYFSDGRKTILFVDDVNELADIKSLIDHVLMHENIKLLVTVRDYAKEAVYGQLKRNASFSELTVNRLRSDEVINILQENFESLPFSTVSHISNMVKGNLRLAFLAASNSDTESSKVFTYKELLERCYAKKIQTISQEQRFSAEIASILGPHKTSNNKELIELQNEYSISHKSYIAACEQLCEEELVDMCQGYSAISFEEQNLRDYFVYSALFVTKEIDLLTVWKLDNGSKHVRRIVNQLTSVFDEDLILEEISNSVSRIWNTLVDKEKLNFISEYGEYLGLSGLEYLRDVVHSLPAKNSCIKKVGAYEIDKHYTLKSELVKCIVIYLRGKYSSIATTLLFEILEKNAVNIENILAVVSNSVFNFATPVEQAFTFRVSFFRQMIARRNEENPELYDLCIAHFVKALMKDDNTKESRLGNVIQVAHGNSITSLSEVINLRREALEFLCSIDSSLAVSIMLSYEPKSVFFNYETVKATCCLIDEMINLEVCPTLFDLIHGFNLLQYCQKKTIQLPRITAYLNSSWASVAVIQILQIHSFDIDTVDANEISRLTKHVQNATKDDIDSLLILLRNAKDSSFRYETNINFGMFLLLRILIEEDQSLAQHFCATYLEYGLKPSIVASLICKEILDVKGYDDGKRSLLTYSFEDLGLWLNKFDMVAISNNCLEASVDKIMMDVREHGEYFWSFEILELEKCYPGLYLEYLAYLIANPFKYDIVQSFTSINLESNTLYESLLQNYPELYDLLEEAITIILSLERWVNYDGLVYPLLIHNPNFVIRLFNDLQIYRIPLEVKKELIRLIWQHQDWNLLIDKLVDNASHMSQNLEYEQCGFLGEIFSGADTPEKKEAVLCGLSRLSAILPDAEFTKVSMHLLEDQKIALLVQLAKQNVEWQTIEAIITSWKFPVDGFSGSYIPILENNINLINKAHLQINNQGIMKYDLEIEMLISCIKETIPQIEIHEFLDPFYK